MKKNTGSVTRRVLVKDGKQWRPKVLTMSGFAGDTERAVELMSMSLTHQFGQRGWKWDKTSK